VDKTRRLNRLEDELDPQAAFLVWLREAQRYPSVIDYARAHAEEGDALGAVFKRAMERARHRLRGRSDVELVRVTRRIRRELLVAYHVVVDVNLEAERGLELDRLRIALLTRWMRELSYRLQLAEHGTEAAQAAAADRLEDDWANWRSTTSELRAEMETTDAARRDIETRFLSGHDSLFPGPAAALADCRHRLDGLIAIATSEGHAVEDPVVTPEDVEGLSDRYVRLASANARLALDEDDAADALIRPLLAAAG
jgi:hypothetical protein